MDPTVIAQTEDYLVIDKPAGYSVEEPSRMPTIQSWLTDTKLIDPSLWPVGERPGTVHRLDVETSGVLIWAKTPDAQRDLKLLWQGRQTEKTYLALVAGETNESGTVELAIKRDNQHDKQTISWLNEPNGRAAITTYKRLGVGSLAGQTVSLLEVKPITGRTHQIRIHLQSQGHPIIGDKTYGNKASKAIATELGLTRQFLHAYRICLPYANSRVCYQSKLPKDLLDSLTRANISPKIDDIFDL